MRGEDIFAALGNINAQYIQEAHAYTAEENASRTRRFTWAGKSIAAAAALFCVLAIGQTSFADSVKGFFRDVFRWDGAIVGSEYLCADGEILLLTDKPVFEEGQWRLPLTVSFVFKEEAPFRSTESIVLESYRITDASGKTVASVTGEEQKIISGVVQDGSIKLKLPLQTEKLMAGESYTLHIDAFTSVKKADAPLPIQGNWSCTFMMPETDN